MQKKPIIRSFRKKNYKKKYEINLKINEDSYKECRQIIILVINEE